MHTSSIRNALFILVLGLLFNFSANGQTSASIDQNRIFIKIEIKGLACPYCAYGMEKELKKVSGVDNVDIELKTGLAYISTPIDQKPSKEQLEKIIVDSGFSVGEIAFKDVPFKVEKIEK